MKTKKIYMKEKKKKIESYLHVLFFKLLGFSSHYFIYLKRREICEEKTFLRHHDKPELGVDWTSLSNHANIRLLLMT